MLIEWPAGDAEPSKYVLSTLPEDTPINDLVGAARQRWRIERDYQDLKQDFGLGHYEGRGWRGFHHHASLSIAAYGFLMAERLIADKPVGGKKTSSNAKCLLSVSLQAVTFDLSCLNAHCIVNWPFRTFAAGHRPASGAPSTDLCQQWSAREIDVGHRQRHECAGRVLRQPAVANLVEAPQPLDHREDVLDTGANLRLVAVLRLLHLVDFAPRLARALVVNTGLLFPQLGVRTKSRSARTAWVLTLAPGPKQLFLMVGVG